MKQPNNETKSLMKQSIAYGMEKIGAPCVVVNCKGQELYFLIDTGSSENQLLDYTYVFFTECYDDVIKEEGGCFVTTGLGGSVESKKYSFAFSIGRTQFVEPFMVLPNTHIFASLSERLGEPLAGILGSRFLRNNGIVVDYADNSLYSKRRRKSVEVGTNTHNAA